MGRIPSTIPDTAKQILARGRHGTLRLITKWGENTRYVWSYTMTIENHSPQPIKLTGRYWNIAWGNTREPMSFPANQFAPSVAGGHPVLYPGQSFSYEAGLVVDGPETPTLRGELEAVEIRTDLKILILVEEFTFSDDSAPDIISGEGLLTAAGAERMKEAVETFNFISRTEGGAIFRPDKIKNMETDDILLINRYLFEFFRIEKQKLTNIDFSPIMPYGHACEIASTDHFMERTSETIYNSRNALYLSYSIINFGNTLRSRNPQDSELASDLFVLIDKWGIDAVQNEILKRKLPEQVQNIWRAEYGNLSFYFDAISCAAAELRDKSHIYARPPLPKLSREQLLLVHRRAEERPWDNRGNYSGGPFEWVRDNYEEWAGNGLLQSHLKCDKKLYFTFSKAVQRKGLPDWLDVPNTSDSLMRLARTPDEQLKILVTRHLLASMTRVVRSLVS